MDPARVILRLLLNYLSHSLFAFALLLIVYAAFIPWITFFGGTAGALLSWLLSLVAGDVLAGTDLARALAYFSLLAWLFGELASIAHERKTGRRFAMPARERLTVTLVPAAVVYALAFASIPFMPTQGSRMAFVSPMGTLFLLTVSALCLHIIVVLVRERYVESLKNDGSSHP